MQLTFASFLTLALAIYKCMFEFTFTQQYFWLPFLDVNMLYSNFTDNPPYNCDATKLAAVFSFITQAAMLGSELIFLTITIDLRMAYTNPFSSYKQNKYYFAMFVVGISISTGIALILMGNSVYGLSVEGSVWIQDRRAENGVSINWPKTVLYYIFILSIYAYCLWAYYVFHKSIRKGFGKTLSNRIPIMERSKKYTLGYIVYGGTILILEFITFLSSNSTPVALKSLPAYFYSFQGVWSLLVISYSNWDEITLENLNPFRFNEADHLVADVAEEGLLLQPHLNSALRAEVLYFSTQGIMHASTEYSRHVRAIDSESQRPSNSNDAHFPENIEDADERYDSRIYSFDDRVGG